VPVGDSHVGDTMAMEWNRDLLVAALVANAPAENACRDALRAGASFLRPGDRSVAVSSLVTIYERRARHLAEHGIRTIGFDEAVERFRDQDGAVKLAQVHSDDFNFVIFLDPVEPAAVACLAVDASAADPEWDYSTWKR
jgi:hypothetical protein